MQENLGARLCHKYSTQLKQFYSTLGTDILYMLVCFALLVATYYTQLSSRDLVLTKDPCIMTYMYLSYTMHTLEWP